MKIEASDIVVSLVLVCATVLVALGKASHDSFREISYGVFGYVARGVSTAMGARKP